MMQAKDDGAGRSRGASGAREGRGEGDRRKAGRARRRRRSTTANTPSRASSTYVNERLGGFEPDTDSAAQQPVGRHRARRWRFPNSTPPATSASRAAAAWSAPVRSPTRATRWCSATSPISRPRSNGEKVADAFMPSISPSNVEEWRRNAYYKTAGGISVRGRRRDARGIQGDRRRRLPGADRRSAAGLLLHGASRTPAIADCRKWANVRVEALNHALRDIPTREDPPPHLLRHQHGSARPRHGGQGLHRHHSRRSAPAPIRSRRRIRATSTNGRSGAAPSCRRTRC